MKPLHVIKIGGAVINHTELLSACLDDLATLEEPLILVHGGGRKVDHWLKKIGHEIRMLEGRRITDEVTLELAVMAYAGWINKQIVSGLQARNVRCLGLSGADLNLISAIKRPPNPIDFGYVGDISEVNDVAFLELVELGITPICCAITHDGNGHLLNTNADTIASAVASALAQSYDVTLWYAFEKEGVLSDVLDESSVIERINEESFAELSASNRIHSGMKPKLANSFSALQKGVKAVHVFSAEKIRLIPQSLGTKITLS